MNVTNYPSPEVIVEADAQVGEVPVWDHRTQRLCWVDIERGHLMESDRGASITSTTSTTQIDGSLGAAVPRAAAPGFGALHRWDGAGASQEIASGLVLPNGLGWDVDDTRMYLVDVWKDRSISLE